MLNHALNKGFIKSGLILEIGIGHVDLPRLLIDYGFTYYGLDSSPMVVDNAQRLNLNIFLGCANAIPRQIPLVDAIWMSHVLEHSENWKSARESIESVYSQLLSGGTLIIISPEILSWRHEFFSCDWSHGYPTSKENICQLLRECKFEIIYSNTHSLGCFNPIFKYIYSIIIKLIPWSVLRWISTILTGRDFITGYLHLLGYESTMVIARK